MTQDISEKKLSVKVTRTRAVASQRAELKKYTPYLNVKVFRPNTTPYPTTPGGCKLECHPSHQIQPLGVVGWGCQTPHISA